MRIAVCQSNPTVGDFAANLAAMRLAFRRARGQNAALVLFPQGALAGAPLEGLVYRESFQRACAGFVADMVAAAKEQGYFPAAPAPAKPGRRKSAGRPMDPAPIPALWEEETGAAARESRRVVLVSSARAFRWRNETRHAAEVAAWCRKHRAAWIGANLAGGQDELVFAGGSLAVGADGRIIGRGAVARADFLCLDALYDDDGVPALNPVGRSAAPADPAAAPAAPHPAAEEYGRLRLALTAAIADYVDKNRIPGVLLGLSGGIDSALAAALAVEALGPGRVRALTLPGPFTSAATLADAKACAARLGIRCDAVPIEALCAAAESSLLPVWGEDGAAPGGLTHQNIQARARGLLLMTLSNSLGWILLNTSNATEGAVGYGTLYGDLTGTFAPLRDLTKDMVWNLARHLNAGPWGPRIPESTIDRVPSAELAPGQEDRQTLPDYPVLDPMVVEMLGGHGLDRITAMGYPRGEAEKMFRLHAASEYKRRQGIPGPRVAVSWPGAGGRGDGLFGLRGQLPPAVRWPAPAAGSRRAEADFPVTEACLASLPPWAEGRWPMTSHFQE